MASARRKEHMMSLDPRGEALRKNHKAEQNIPYTIKNLIRCLPFLRHLTNNTPRKQALSYSPLYKQGS